MIQESPNFQRDRELRNLWLSIVVAISFAAYHVEAELGRFTASSHGVYHVVSNALMFWIFGLLWVAYRRWRDAEKAGQELNAIMGSITTEAIVMIDPQRRIRACNSAVQGLFGRSSDQLIGHTTDTLYGDRRADKTRPGEIRDALDAHGFHVGVTEGLRSDGASFPLEIVTARLRGPGGAVLVMRDITERCRAEAAILQAKDSAEQSYARLKEMEKLRDALTHMIVHDMRTPIQILLSNQELLTRYYDDQLAPDVRTMVDEMMTHTMKLGQMANAVLNVSRLESGKLPLNKTACDAGELADEVLKALKILTREHNVKRSAEAAKSPAWCDADVTRRVLANLVTNAVKFTPTGGQIQVHVRPESGMTRVEVRDAGSGIPQHEQGRIFEKYAQAEGGKKKSSVHSAGLGLTFCKMAVEAQGGTIGVTSEPGQGATFWFTLPSQETG